MKVFCLKLSTRNLHYLISSFKLVKSKGHSRRLMLIINLWISLLNPCYCPTCRNHLTLTHLCHQALLRLAEMMWTQTKPPQNIFWKVLKLLASIAQFVAQCQTALLVWLKVCELRQEREKWHYTQTHINKYRERESDWSWKHLQHLEHEFCYHRMHYSNL